jgi:hypothetical protein
VNPFLRTPTVAEAALLDVVYDAYVAHGQWPYYQYVDSTLYNDHGNLDAQSLILGCPRVSIAPAGIGSYGWIRSANPTLSALLAGDAISLTIAGMAHVPRAAPVVRVFLDALAYLIERERSVTPSPTSVQLVGVTSHEVRQALGMLLRQRPMVDALGDVLQHEPSTWACNLQATDEGGWTVSPGSFLRRYRDISDVADYLDRLLNQLSPEAASHSEPTVVNRQAEGAHRHEFDFFISHASEDKDAIARPLFQALVNRRCAVWFDEAELNVGDSLLRSINEGLLNCDHGVVVLSPSFFGKGWPEHELAGLTQRAMNGEERIILPVWHEVTQADVRRYSPSLADIVAVESTRGPDAVADALLKASSSSD